MNRYGKRCVLYPRVSTEMQVDGYSLEGQKNMLTRFADREEKLKVLHNKELKETEFIKNSTKTLLRISRMSCITKIYHPEERHWMRSGERMNLLVNMLMGSRSSR